MGFVHAENMKDEAVTGLTVLERIQCGLAGRVDQLYEDALLISTALACYDAKLRHQRIILGLFSVDIENLTKLEALDRSRGLRPTSFQLFPIRWVDP
jgi:hypothetical protein